MTKFCTCVRLNVDFANTEETFCRWDDEHMVLEDALHGEMNSVLPMMHIEPKMDFEPDPENYKSPLYKTGLRAGVLSTTGEI